MSLLPFNKFLRYSLVILVGLQSCSRSAFEEGERIGTPENLNVGLDHFQEALLLVIQTEDLFSCPGYSIRYEVEEQNGILNITLGDVIEKRPCLAIYSPSPAKAKLGLTKYMNRERLQFSIIHEDKTIKGVIRFMETPDIFLEQNCCIKVSVI